MRTLLERSDRAYDFLGADIPADAAAVTVVSRGYNRLNSTNTQPAHSRRSR